MLKINKVSHSKHPPLQTYKTPTLLKWPTVVVGPTPKIVCRNILLLFLDFPNLGHVKDTVEHATTEFFLIKKTIVLSTN